MGITAYTGPLVTFGRSITYGSSVVPSEYNEQYGPNVLHYGAMFADHRVPYSYVPGGADTSKVYGWYGIGYTPVIDQVPTVISTNSVAQTQALTAGTALTLTASNTNNVTIGQSITAPETGQTVTGLRAIDGVMTTVTWGSAATVTAWNPATAIARCITITVTGTSVNQNDGGMYWSVAGRDIYGFKVSEQIAGSTATSSVAVTYTSQKAYKYITSVTPVNSTGTLTSTAVIVGVSDTFGLPLAASNGAYVRLFMGNSATTSSTNVTAYSSVTATSTTADVRGTFTSSLASDGTRRLVVFQTPSLSILGSSNQWLYAGVTQYSSV